MSNSDHFECHSNFWPKAFWPDLECQEFGRISVSHSISCGRCKTGLKWQELAISPPNNFILLLLWTPMQDVKGQSPFLSSSLHPNLPPLPTSQFPQSTLVRRRTCLLIHHLPPCRPAQFHGRLVFGHSQALSRSEAPSPPVETWPQPQAHWHKRAALCSVNTRFGINCIHLTENWDSASRSWNLTSNFSKLAFLSLPS